VYPFVLGAGDGVASLLLLQLAFCLHGFYEIQIAALSFGYDREVLSFKGKLRNVVNEICCDGNRLIQP